ITSEIDTIKVPDRLVIEIDSFTFNCNTCDNPLRLPWARVQAGIETPPFSIDCSNCRNQITFNYGEANRKTLNLRFRPYFELANLEPMPISNIQSMPATISQAPVKVEPKMEAVSDTGPRYSPGLEYDRAILEKG